jgi:hypothetical protein
MNLTATATAADQAQRFDPDTMAGRVLAELLDGPRTKYDLARPPAHCWVAASTVAKLRHVWGVAIESETVAVPGRGGQAVAYVARYSIRDPLARQHARRLLRLESPR